MNEEEKEAIEFLKHSIFEYEEIDTSVLEYIDKNHKIIYKLILKQQKEIETLKESQFVLYGHDGNIAGCIRLGNDVISKDKIRKEIEEIKNCRLSTCDEQINKSLKERYEIEDEICEYFEELLGE